MINFIKLGMEKEIYWRILDNTKKHWSGNYNYLLDFIIVVTREQSLFSQMKYIILIKKHYWKK